MARTSSIYDHFDLYLTLTFNLPEKCFKWHFSSSWTTTVQNYFEILVVGRGGCGGVARVSDFVFLQKNPCLKKRNCLLFEGVKVREDWLV